MTPKPKAEETLNAWEIRFQRLRHAMSVISSEKDICQEFLEALLDARTPAKDEGEKCCGTCLYAGKPPTFLKCTHCAPVYRYQYWTPKPTASANCKDCKDHPQCKGVGYWFDEDKNALMLGMCKIVNNTMKGKTIDELSNELTCSHCGAVGQPHKPNCPLYSGERTPAKGEGEGKRPILLDDTMCWNERCDQFDPHRLSRCHAGAIGICDCQFDVGFKSDSVRTPGDRPTAPADEGEEKCLVCPMNPATIEERNAAKESYKVRSLQGRCKSAQKQITNLQATLAERDKDFNELLNQNMKLRKRIEGLKTKDLPKEQPQDDDEAPVPGVDDIPTAPADEGESCDHLPCPDYTGSMCFDCSKGRSMLIPAAPADEVKMTSCMHCRSDDIDHIDRLCLRCGATAYTLETKIIALQAALAEKTREVESCDLIQRGLTDGVNRLQDIVAEKEKELERRVSSHCSDVARLKKELAERGKRIEELEKGNADMLALSVMEYTKLEAKLKSAEAVVSAVSGLEGMLIDLATFVRKYGDLDNNAHAFAPNILRDRASRLSKALSAHDKEERRKG